EGEVERAWFWKYLPLPGLAPKSLKQLISGVLILFAAAAAIVSISSGNLGRLVVVALIVFGFSLAIYAFDTVVRAKNYYLGIVGIIVCACLLLSITGFFLGNVSYFRFRSPEFIGRWFANEQGSETARRVSRHLSALIMATRLQEFDLSVPPIDAIFILDYSHYRNGKVGFTGPFP